MQELDQVRSVLPSKVFVLTSKCNLRPSKDGYAGSELVVCCSIESHLLASVAAVQCDQC